MPRDLADVLRQDRIRLTHMLESAKRSVRIAAGCTAATLAADEIRLLCLR